MPRTRRGRTSSPTRATRRRQRGDDEFTRFLDLPGADRSWWEANGFGTEVIDTEFAFESTDDARRLLSRYLGRSVEDPPLRLDYRVGLFTATA